MKRPKIQVKATLKTKPEEKYPAVYLYWQGKPESSVIRKGYDQALVLLTEGKLSRMLFDLRAAEAADAEDLEWIREDWLPRAAAAGFRRAAVTEPANVVAYLAAAKPLSLAKTAGITGKFFKTLDEARFWLSQQG